MASDRDPSIDRAIDEDVCFISQTQHFAYGRNFAMDGDVRVLREQIDLSPKPLIAAYINCWQF